MRYVVDAGRCAGNVIRCTASRVYSTVVCAAGIIWSTVLNTACQGICIASQQTLSLAQNFLTGVQAVNSAAAWVFQRLTSLLTNNFRIDEISFGGTVTANLLSGSSISIRLRGVLSRAFDLRLTITFGSFAKLVSDLFTAAFRPILESLSRLGRRSLSDGLARRSLASGNPIAPVIAPIPADVAQFLVGLVISPVTGVDEDAFAAWMLSGVDVTQGVAL